MKFCEFAKQCKYRKETSTASLNRVVCSYKDKNVPTRLLLQCNDYNCILFKNEYVITNENREEILNKLIMELEKYEIKVTGGKGNILLCKYENPCEKSLISTIQRLLKEFERLKIEIKEGNVYIKII